MKLQQMMMATPSSPRFGADGEGFQVLDLVFFSTKVHHVMDLKSSQKDQRTHSELVHQSGLRRSCAGLHRLELGVYPWLLVKPEVLNDGRRENNMEFFMKHGIFIMLF